MVIRYCKILALPVYVRSMSFIYCILPVSYVTVVYVNCSKLPMACHHSVMVGDELPMRQHSRFRGY